MTDDGSLVLLDYAWQHLPGRWVRLVRSIDKDVDIRAGCPVGWFGVEDLLDIGAVEVDLGLGMGVGKSSCYDGKHGKGDLGYLPGYPRGSLMRGQ